MNIKTDLNGKTKIEFEMPLNIYNRCFRYTEFTLYGDDAEVNGVSYIEGGGDIGGWLHIDNIPTQVEVGYIKKI